MNSTQTANACAAVTEAISESRRRDAIQSLFASEPWAAKCKELLTIMAEDWTDAGEGVWEFWGSDWRVHLYVPRQS